MKTRPISFTAPMVRALLAGTKTQTRRPVNPLLFIETTNPDRIVEQSSPEFADAAMRWAPCPFGAPGDRLWVRETARVVEYSHDMARVCVQYEADGVVAAGLSFPERIKRPKVGNCIANGVHREGSRLTLEVTEVRVQRFSDISEEDARAEGVQPVPFCKAGRAVGLEHVEAFEDLIASLYGPEAWNQWCWVVTFRRVP